MIVKPRQFTIFLQAEKESLISSVPIPLIKSFTNLDTVVSSLQNRFGCIGGLPASRIQHDSHSCCGYIWTGVLLTAGSVEKGEQKRKCVRGFLLLSFCQPSKLLRFP